MGRIQAVRAKEELEIDATSCTIKVFMPIAITIYNMIPTSSPPEGLLLESPQNSVTN